MKFYVNTKELSSSLTTVIKALPSKAIEPIFSHILLDAKDGVLKLTASDGQFTIKASLEAQVETSGSVALPGREFTNLVKTFDTPTLEISAERNNNCSIKTGKSSYKLNTLPSEQFPLSPSIQGITFSLKQSELEGIIKETSFAIAPPEEVRAVLKGVLFFKEGENLSIVSADGRRMALRKVSVSEGENFEKVFPKKLIANIAPLLKAVENPVKFIVNDNLVSVTVDNVSFISGVINGKFPNFKQVIPGSRASDDIIVNRISLLSAMKRACLMATDQESPNLLKFSFTPEGITITANTQDVGEAYEEVPALGCGERKQISFNGKYLLECLAALSVTDIVLNVADPMSSATVKKSVDDEGFLAVIMPVRLK